MIEEYRKIIKGILEAFERVPFSVIIEVATDKKVEAFDLRKDKALIDEISELADLTMRNFHQNPIRKRRINEVSNFLEKEFPKMFSSNREKFLVLREVRQLGGAGYPDEEVEDLNGEIIYIDVKATQRPEESSPRDFYITPLKQTKRKVRRDAKHAILAFIIRGEPLNFRTVGWKLVDLSKIRVSMKPEFNADNREIYRNETILREGYIDHPP